MRVVGLFAHWKKHPPLARMVQAAVGFEAKPDVPEKFSNQDWSGKFFRQKGKKLKPWMTENPERAARFEKLERMKQERGWVM